MTSPKPNKLLVGKYREAVTRFDQARAKLYTSRGPKAVRQLLNTLDRTLFDMRIALWNREKAAKKEAANRVTTTPDNPFARLPVSFGWTPVLLNPPAVWGGGFQTGGFVQIAGQFIAYENSNPLMKKDEYRQGLDALHRARTELDSIVDPKAARRVVDRMLRDILTVRRGLWRVEKR